MFGIQRYIEFARTYRRQTLSPSVRFMSVLGGATQTQPVEAYPTRPISIIVPFSASDGTDLMARLFVQAAKKSRGEQVRELVLASDSHSRMLRAQQDQFKKLWAVSPWNQ